MARRTLKSAKTFSKIISILPSRLNRRPPINSSTTIAHPESVSVSTVLAIMFCLRRAAIRVLSSSPSTSTSIKSRSITSLTYNIPRNNASRITFPTSTLPIQRRYASDEAATQSEPEADGATEAQHGDNSIAASADPDADVDAPTQSETSAAASNIESATESATETTKETAGSAADSAKETATSTTSTLSGAAQSAAETITGAAESLGAAAGFGSASRLSRDRNVPAQDGEPSKTVYVGNLFFDVRAADLKQEFERAGPVTDAKIIMDNRGLSKGFGYVEFETVEAATKAIELYNLQNFEGRRLSVQFSISKERSGPFSGPSFTDRPLHAPTKTLFIGNMSFDMSDRDLNNLFREIKNVIDVRVAIDRRTGQPRGFAHADFVDIESAEKAYGELKGRQVCGRALRVDFSTSTGRAAVGASAAGAGAAGAGAAGASAAGSS